MLLGGCWDDAAGWVPRYLISGSCWEEAVAVVEMAEEDLLNEDGIVTLGS